LVNSRNRWLRRASATSLIIPAKKGMFLSEIKNIAFTLRFDRDDLVCKGIGWMLREAAKKNQKEIFSFYCSIKKTLRALL
jgi:3-methyladenine DNA glycosylase AlkD